MRTRNKIIGELRIGAAPPDATVKYTRFYLLWDHTSRLPIDTPSTFDTLLMNRKRRRSTRSAGESGRRGFLLKLGSGAAILAGAGATILPAESFSLANAGRNAPVDAASEGNGIVGIVRQETVKKNSRDPMVEFTNNGSQDVDIQVTLNDCGDGTLYNNNGSSGCSVVLTLPVGQSEFADINADITGTIPYDVSVSEVGGSTFRLLTSGTVEAQSGRVKGAVRVQKPAKDSDFTANLPQGKKGNNWTVKQVDVRDDDGDSDLDEVSFEVSVSGQGIVGSETVNNPPTDRYNPKGNPAVTITPNDPNYTIQTGTQYTLTVTGTDADGNFATATVDDTP